VHPPPRDDRGESLIEILLSITILGIAVIAIVAAMGTSILASDLRSKQARSETFLRNWVESIATPDTPYVECATPGAAGYSAANLGASVPAGYTATITAISYWNGSSTSPAVFGAAPASCPTSDNGLQQLTLRISSNDGRTSRSTSILKRRP
jgi:Tfp pilus assembly protein PilV